VIEREDQDIDIHVYMDDDEAELWEEYTGLVSAKCHSMSTPWLDQKGKINGGYLVALRNSLDVVHEYEDDVPDDEESCDDLVEGPYGSMVDKNTFNRLAVDGCGVCSAQIKFGDDCDWFNNTPICEHCTEEELPKLLSGEN
jgi:hypothetical protein